MPTVLIIGSYRFFFYAGDQNEPYHVHVERDEKIAKFWLDPVRLAFSGDFNRKEIKKIQEVVEEYKLKIIEAWNEYFSN